MGEISGDRTYDYTAVCRKIRNQNQESINKVLCPKSMTYIPVWFYTYRDLTSVVELQEQRRKKMKTIYNVHTQKEIALTNKTITHQIPSRQAILLITSKVLTSLNQ